MPKLPVVSGKQLIKALQKGGFAVVRQKGSHVSLQKGEFRVVVPLHEDLSKSAVGSWFRVPGSGFINQKPETRN